VLVDDVNVVDGAASMDRAPSFKPRRLGDEGDVVDVRRA
jgi:hypothetical protein